VVSAACAAFQEADGDLIASGLAANVFSNVAGGTAAHATAQAAYSTLVDRCGDSAYATLVDHALQDLSLLPTLHGVKKPHETFPVGLVKLTVLMRNWGGETCARSPSEATVVAFLKQLVTAPLVHVHSDPRLVAPCLQGLQALLAAAHRQVRLTQHSCGVILGCCAQVSAAALADVDKPGCSASLQSDLADAVSRALSLISFVLTKHERRCVEIAAIIVGTFRSALKFLEKQTCAHRQSAKAPQLRLVARALARCVERAAHVSHLGGYVDRILVDYAVATRKSSVVDDALQMLLAPMQRLAELARQTRGLESAHARLAETADRNTFHALFQPQKLPQAGNARKRYAT